MVNFQPPSLGLHEKTRKPAVLFIPLAAKGAVQERLGLVFLSISACHPRIFFWDCRCCWWFPCTKVYSENADVWTPSVPLNLMADVGALLPFPFGVSNTPMQSTCHQHMVRIFSSQLASNLPSQRDWAWTLGPISIVIIWAPISGGEETKLFHTVSCRHHHFQITLNSFGCFAG